MACFLSSQRSCIPRLQTQHLQPNQRKPAKPYNEMPRPSATTAFSTHRLVLSAKLKMGGVIENGERSASVDPLSRTALRHISSTLSISCKGHCVSSRALATVCRHCTMVSSSKALGGSAGVRSMGIAFPDQNVERCHIMYVHTLCHRPPFWAEAPCIFEPSAARLRC
jgi:hypothetical protein